MKKRALISVFYKDGVLELSRALHESGWEILSTGGTAKYLGENSIPVTDVSSVTGFPECLDGRVKTLHPKIHAGLLARRCDSVHMKTLSDLCVTPIDLVCVNLYPFFEKVQAGLTFDETVEFIDIGGPSMLRSAAKNFQDVAVLIDPADYAQTITYIKKSGDSKLEMPLEFRRCLAAKVFNATSAYDAAVARFMFGVTGTSAQNCADTCESAADSSFVFPEYFTVPLKKTQDLRYGENAHQKAALYLTADKKGAFGGMKQLQGKELSYNNIRDLDVAWKAVCAYKRHVQKNEGDIFTVALKHNTPCGAAVGTSVLDSYNKTYKCDPVSIFGGIIGSNAKIDEKAAAEMVKTFLEVIVAPSFDQAALDVFAQKKNLRLIQADIPASDEFEFMSVDGGALVQNRDNTLFEKWDVVTEKEPTEAQKDEMAFGMTVALFAKSNAIVVVKDKTAIGIGAGQTNRIWAASQALERAKEVTEGAEVLVSDAFFPFADCVEKAAQYGIKAIIQPGGSLRDQESIDACNRLGISMVFTGARHFKH